MSDWDKQIADFKNILYNSTDSDLFHEFHNCIFLQDKEIDNENRSTENEISNKLIDLTLENCDCIDCYDYYLNFRRFAFFFAFVI